MMFSLSYYEKELTKNINLIETSLQQKNYQEALSLMDQRLLLIDGLSKLAGDDEIQQQNISTLAAELFFQEVDVKAIAYHHHQAIFKKLTKIGQASKAGQAYTMNSKRS